MTHRMAVSRQIHLLVAASFGWSFSATTPDRKLPRPGRIGKAWYDLVEVIEIEIGILVPEAAIAKLLTVSDLERFIDEEIAREYASS